VLRRQPGHQLASAVFRKMVGRNLIIASHCGRATGETPGLAVRPKSAKHLEPFHGRWRLEINRNSLVALSMDPMYDIESEIFLHKALI
jgi:hypothetical protein